MLQVLLIATQQPITWHLHFTYSYCILSHLQCDNINMPTCCMLNVCPPPQHPSLDNLVPAPVPGTTRPHAPPPQPQLAVVLLYAVVHFRPEPRRLIICLSNFIVLALLMITLTLTVRRSTLLMFAVSCSQQSWSSPCDTAVDLRLLIYVRSKPVT